MDPARQGKKSKFTRDEDRIGFILLKIKRIENSKLLFNMKVPENHSLFEVLQRDQRYAPEAYLFVTSALTYANKVMDFGEQEGEREERHVSGQQLCEAIRRFALDQFGIMAKAVFNSWGIRETKDFGEIVYNLIEIEQFSKTDNDSVEDFNNVFDFDKDLAGDYKIELPKDRFCK